MRRVDPERLVFIDEAGANLAMGRSHAWVLRGREYVEPRPMNWGDNLTLVGAIRRRGWVALGTCWRAMNAKAFLRWVRRALVPRLWRGAIVVLDNLGAHKQAAVRAAIERVGATVKYLPPYSHDFNPIESAWALVKKHIKTCARRERLRPPPSCARRSPCGPPAPLRSLVRSCRVRQLKYLPGVNQTCRPKNLRR